VILNEKNIKNDKLVQQMVDDELELLVDFLAAILE
jgi:hypothetical protein